MCLLFSFIAFGLPNLYKAPTNAGLPPECDLDSARRGDSHGGLLQVREYLFPFLGLGICHCDESITVSVILLLKFEWNWEGGLRPGGRSCCPLPGPDICLSILVSAPFPLPSHSLPSTCLDLGAPILL